MTTGHGLLLSDDLIFSSKVQATARAYGGTVGVARTVDSLLSRLAEVQPAAIILDLNFPRLDLPALLDRVRQSSLPEPRIIGYGSHVDVATLKAARQAGVDPVMPRSQFVQQLETQLTAWLGLSASPLLEND